MSTAATRAPLLKWELIAPTLWRVPVPGGWLYRTTDDTTSHVALAFVPKESSRFPYK